MSEGTGPNNAEQRVDFHELIFTAAFVSVCSLESGNCNGSVQVYLFTEGVDGTYRGRHISVRR